MILFDIVERNLSPDPWSEGDNIPWNDLEFSQRMLKEHLSQEHDAASRKTDLIEKQVAWIAHNVIPTPASSVLDLGCGPGLYTSKLAQRGHQCTGIDYSPASIAYAREQDSESTYILGDLRDTDFGGGYDVAMLIFGEFNIFAPDVALKILQKAYHALNSGGTLLLEPHTYEAILAIRDEPASWYASRGGLFSDKPHIRLEESLWHEAHSAVTRRYYIIDTQTNAVTKYASSFLAYTEQGYSDILKKAGFQQVQFYPSLLGIPDERNTEFLVVTARKG